MKELKGHKIERIYINDDKDFILLKAICRLGIIKYFGYKATGGCCSETWFESIDDLEALLSRREVIRVESVQFDTVVTEDNYDEKHTKIYGYKLYIKDEGIVTIEFRNCSNGYYEGECERVHLISMEDKRADTRIYKVTHQFRELSSVTIDIVKEIIEWNRNELPLKNGKSTI